MTYKEDREESRQNFIKLGIDAIEYLGTFSNNEEYQRHLTNLKGLLLDMR